MTLWLLAAGLLASGPYHNARGYSGDARIDFGRVIPGHTYYYRTYFRNEAGVPLRLSSSSVGCGGCPQVVSSQSRLASGDSTELNFLGFFGKNVGDSLWRDVYLHTDDGSRRGLWMYRVRFLAGRPDLFRARMKPVAVDPNREGYLEGSVTIVSRSKKTLMVRPVGMPHGVMYSPEVPAALKPGASLKLTFRAPPEFFTRHRSITLEAMAADGVRGERLSLPFAP